MTAENLIKLLQNFDPESQVFFMEKASFPIENEIAAVIGRSKLNSVENDNKQNFSENDFANGSDILILGGKAVRYGCRKAWDYI